MVGIEPRERWKERRLAWIPRRLGGDRLPRPLKPGTNPLDGNLGTDDSDSDARRRAFEPSVYRAERGNAEPGIDVAAPGTEFEFRFVKHMRSHQAPSSPWFRSNKVRSPFDCASSP